MKIGDQERITQNRVVQLFQHTLGYEYLGDWHYRKGNANIEVEYLEQYLRQHYPEVLVQKAIHKFQSIAKQSSDDLYSLNKEVYQALKYGIKIRPEVGENKKTVWLINWKEPLTNHFAIAEEVTIKGTNTCRPDIVLYINGIALGVLELKKATNSIAKGIRQNLDNQRVEFIRSFFATQQLVLAGNDSQGLKYGTIKTEKKYYLSWKEPDANDYPELIDAEITTLYQQQESLLDQHLIQLCHPKRILELIHDFIVFDVDVKKVCRPNQYFGVKATQRFLARREGGILWHTQGSGKSLTMVWLAKWILSNQHDARILIITDREELDEQIESVFTGVDETIHRAASGANLVDKLNQTTPRLMCSLIHKFGRKDNASNADYDKFIDNIRSNLPKDFKAKGDLYIFVDECHRTQSGKLHDAMRIILPHALMIGFTGTPLLKKDKKTSFETFGRYIHKYKFDEAIKDGVVLDLRYEARNVEQHISSQKRIDEWFEASTSGMNEFSKSRLKKKWGTMKNVLSSRSRLYNIAKDIFMDMHRLDRLMNRKGNAMLVASSIYEACRYYDIFQSMGFTECGVVTSYEPSISDLKDESVGQGKKSLKEQQYDLYKKMLGDQSPQDYEKIVKRDFKEKPSEMRLLIVVDKLLTGFDAPKATYLYIDKSMRDHGLFQAICHVNRLDGPSKEYGFIIDYKDLFNNLTDSMKDYTSDAFDNFDEEDVKGLLNNRLKKAKERLDEVLDMTEALCEPVKPPKETMDYIRYFCGDISIKEDLKRTEKHRHQFYLYTSALARAYANIANELEKAGYTSAERKHIKDRLKHFTYVREVIQLRSGDYIDLKEYDTDMRHLIDAYIAADESEVIASFGEQTLLDIFILQGEEGLIKQVPKRMRQDRDAMAETIESNVRKVIINEMATNPKYYEDMSKLLEEIIEQRKADQLSYEQYLKDIQELAKKTTNPAQSQRYDAALKTKALRALYDNLHQDIIAAVAIDAAVKASKKDNWRDNRIKMKQVRNAIKKVLPEGFDLEEVFKLVLEQEEY